jgi:hypothetical protein
MTQSQLNKLIALSEKERLEQITKVANKISKLVGKSFKDVSALLQYARLINDRSLDPLTKKKVEKLADELFDRVRVEITGGISGALKQSEKLSNHIESQITGVKPKLDVSGSDAALQSYLNKKQSDGFRFSKRIWKHNNLYKKKMNDAITDALKTGKSAKQLAKDLAGFVSPKAKGKGIYTDPRKNAERLARSEINMAYRRADSERWAKQWFVVGIKVNLSPAHPIFDLCDALDNRYPKDFVFVGWHPQCLCYATPILCSEAEQGRMNEYRLGLRPNPPKLRTVNKMPKDALQWVKMNKDRIAGWQTKPYWLQDNKRYFKEVLR